jgi:hypothetical protein
MQYAFDDDEPVHLRYREGGDYLYDPLTGKPVLILQGEFVHELTESEGDGEPQRHPDTADRLRRAFWRFWRPAHS